MEGARCISTLPVSRLTVQVVLSSPPYHRDVLNVLGMYPGDPGAPGGDCAGVVVASGAGVSHLRPGDAVFGLAGGSLGSHVHVSAQTVTHVS